MHAFDAFRLALFEASHCPRLIKTINELRLASERYRYVYYSFGGVLARPPSGAEIHHHITRIVDDFEAGKTDLIEKEILAT